MKIACVGYREWALNIYDNLAKKTDHQFLIFRSRAQYDEKVLAEFNPQLVLFYGWSWIVPKEMVKNFKCVMLHPSPLPKYRGGSPIQNQIIAGETESAVTLFLMDQGMDTGAILTQKKFTLEGSMKEILRRIQNIGEELTLELFSKGLHPTPQKEAEASVYSRRSPEQSEITLEEIQTQSASYIYNKVRMLQSPYPSAFIMTADKKKLLIHDVSIERDE